MTDSIHAFSAIDIQGCERSLSEWRDQVLLIVNVASRCGFTPQYHGLQELYATHGEKGFSVLGFPCDQFGHQEPGDEAEIQSFCQTQFDVDFPMFAKVRVHGKGVHPLFAWLTRQAPGVLGIARIKWNFTKFLIDRNGRPVRRYAPATPPERIGKDIIELLEA